MLDPSLYAKDRTAILTIDGRTVEARLGASVLEAALEAGIYIPHLCDHPDLPPAGACRLCVVEVEGTPEPVASCLTPAADGLVVTTQFGRVGRAPPAGHGTHAGHPSAGMRLLREVPQLRTAVAQAVPGRGGVAHQAARQAPSRGQFEPAVRLRPQQVCPVRPLRAGVLGRARGGRAPLSPEERRVLRAYACTTSLWPRRPADSAGRAPRSVRRVPSRTGKN